MNPHRCGRDRGTIAPYHGPIADQIGVFPHLRSDIRGKARAQPPEHERIQRRIDAAGCIAHQKRLVGEDGRDAVDTPRGDAVDLAPVVTSKPLSPDVGTHTATHQRSDERTHRQRQPGEKLARSAIEVGVVEPALADHNPIQVVLEHLLHGPGNALLLRRETLVEIDSVLVLQVEPDQRRVRHHGSIVDDVGQLALRRLANIRRLSLVRLAGELQEHLGLGDERTGIRQPEAWTKRVQRDHRGSSSFAGGFRLA